MAKDQVLGNQPVTNLNVLSTGVERGLDGGVVVRDDRDGPGPQHLWRVGHWSERRRRFSRVRNHGPAALTERANLPAKACRDEWRSCLQVDVSGHSVAEQGIVEGLVAIQE